MVNDFPSSLVTGHWSLLIVALTTFETTEFGDGEFFFTIFLSQLFMYFFIIRIGIIDIGSAVAVDTPSHGKGCVLFYYLHSLYIAMALLASHPCYSHVLRVVEVHVVREVMDTSPLHWFLNACAFSGSHPTASYSFLISPS